MPACPYEPVNCVVEPLVKAKVVPVREDNEGFTLNMTEEVFQVHTNMNSTAGSEPFNVQQTRVFLPLLVSDWSRETIISGPTAKRHRNRVQHDLPEKQPEWCFSMPL